VPVRVEDLMRRDLSIRTFSAMCGIVAAVLIPASAQTQAWQTSAKWHRTFKKAERGTLTLDADGVEFRSPKFNRRWKYLDIHTFDLSQRELTLLTYENRPWHEPGERPFRFTLTEPMPPKVAAEFANRVGKPVRNGAPIASTAAIQEIPAHHRAWLGGSNGLLRLKEDGIVYVTESGLDSRSWSWSDIQTLASPNPYEFRVTAFREIAEFDLKQPLRRDVFEKLWDRLYAAGLNVSSAHGEIQQ
jgi:hypothetical protein